VLVRELISERGDSNAWRRDQSGSLPGRSRRLVWPARPRTRVFLPRS